MDIKINTNPKVNITKDVKSALEQIKKIMEMAHELSQTMKKIDNVTENDGEAVITSTLIGTVIILVDSPLIGTVRSTIGPKNAVVGILKGIEETISTQRSETF